MLWSTTFKTRQKLSFWFYSCLGQPSSSFHKDYRSDFIPFPSMFWSTILSSHRDGRSVLIGFYSMFWSTMFKATHQFLYRRRVFVLIEREQIKDELSNENSREKIRPYLRNVTKAQDYEPLHAYFLLFSHEFPDSLCRGRVGAEAVNSRRR